MTFYVTKGEKHYVFKIFVELQSEQDLIVGKLSIIFQKQRAIPTKWFLRSFRW